MLAELDVRDRRTFFPFFLSQLAVSCLLWISEDVNPQRPNNKKPPGLPCLGCVRRVLAPCDPISELSLPSPLRGEWRVRTAAVAGFTVDRRRRRSTATKQQKTALWAVCCCLVAGARTRQIYELGGISLKLV